MKALFRLLIIAAVFLRTLVSGAEPLDPAQVFGVKEVCISDGSSIYVFSPDGKFRMEPLGLSGRTIEGSWKRDSVTIHVTGKWGWINGLSTPDDFREMDLHIGWLKETTKEHTSILTGEKHKLHEGYFLIERVEKLPAKR